MSGNLLRTAGLVSLLLVASKRRLDAEHLPLRIYGEPDGLRGIAVHRIVSDSKGFLWFCTNEGLSRYDGYGFTQYGAAGFTNPNVHSLLETRDGGYWVGTADGLFRLGDRGGRADAFLPPGPDGARWISTVTEDGPSALWVGTHAGPFRFYPATGRFERVELPGAITRPYINAVLRDRSSELWVASTAGLYRLGTAGIERYSTENGFPSNTVNALAQDSTGRVWAGTEQGLCRITSGPAGGRILDRVYTVDDGLPDNSVRALLHRTDGSLWIGTQSGLAEMPGSGAAPHRLTLPAATGLDSADILCLAEDRNRNLWIGTNFGGTVKIARSGFVTYDSTDGLASGRIVSLMEDANGRVIALTRTAGRLFVNWFDGGRFHAGAVPASPAHFGENWPVWDQLLVQSRNGEWWCASAAGLLRFPAVDLPELSRTKAIRVYGPQDNLGTDHIYQIFEDSRGRLWISTRTPQENGLIIRDPASGSFRNFYESDGIPALKLETWANHFFEDRAGQVWIGLHRTGVIRYAHGKFRTFSTADGLPPGGIRRFHQDHQGRLWLGSGAGGAARVDDPEAEQPRFVTYNTAQGLSGNEIQAITEDQWGRIYFATGNVVDRLDPATGQVRSYTQADGLARGEVQAAVCDRQGNLWFATVYGVSTLVPDQDDASTPPPVRIVDVSVGGIPLPIRESPGTEIVLPDVAADRNRIEIGFGGISFIPGEVLRYEYLLEGADESWKQPTRQRSVIYESVRPGHYRFLVRAIDSSGALSLPPAAVRFHVLAPLWMRWWSLALLATSACGILYAAHRYRAERLLEIERMRLRLASDLHDELGSGLASIGVLSEFANQSLSDKGQASDAISRVAEISRELLESMGDLLWSLDPRPDSLGDLTGRMRAFANDMLAGAGIELDFRSTGPLEKQKIDPEVRRQIYLIFREAIHNVLRHSRCNRVVVEISCADGRLVLSIRDDGVGFDAAAHTEGRGIESMHRRAETLRGRIEWKRDQGTNVILTIPLHK